MGQALTMTAFTPKQRRTMAMPEEEEVVQAPPVPSGHCARGSQRLHPPAEALLLLLLFRTTIMM